jgi:hypothetical protein
MSTIRSPPNESLKGVKRCVEASLRALFSPRFGGRDCVKSQIPLKKLRLVCIKQFLEPNLES